MKSMIVFALALLVSFTACTKKTKPAEEQVTVPEKEIVVPIPVITQELTGYFLKNTYKQEADFKLLIINDNTIFQGFFGTAKTMSNIIIKPDFGTSIIGAISLKETKNETIIKFEKAEIIDGICQMYATVETGKAQSFSTTPVFIFAMEKAIPAKQFELFINGEKKDTVVIE